jgi:hypothetical protein
MEKRCCKCKKWLNVDEFHKDKSRKDGFYNKCKKCSSEKSKKYYIQNKDKIKKRNIQNKDKIKKRNAEYTKKNKAIISKQKQKYRKQNACYKMFYDKLTIVEYPRLANDDISLEVKCRYCGKYFIPNNGSVRHRIQSLNGNQRGDMGLYCSDGCKKSCPIYGQVSYPKDYKKATSREVQPELRQMVLARDNYECQYCQKGINETQLHCHHIWPLNESPITSADIDDCITLCIDCHKLIHMNIDGCKYSDMKCSSL